MSVSLPAPRDLRINLLREPLCLGRGSLSFSWVMSPAPNPEAAHATAARQTAYRLVIAEGIRRAEAGLYVCDTGWQTSSDSTAIRPAGWSECLTVGVLYYAQVAIRDGEGQESPLCAPLAFTVDTDWVSTEGIWGERVTDDASAPTTPDFLFVRHEFSLTEDELSATDHALVTVTATSPEPSRQFVYNLSVNGTEMGVGPARYGKLPTGEPVLFTQTYDVTDVLCAGDNCLAAVCYALSDRGFLCQLTRYDREGTPHVLTNSGRDAALWQVLDGDAIYGHSTSIGTHYFTAHACHIDTHLYPFGYAEAGFSPLATVDTVDAHRPHWKSPCRIGRIGGGMLLCPAETEPVRRYEADTETLTVTDLPNGDRLIDLGAEIIGGLHLAVDLPTDCTVTLSYGEQRTDGDDCAVKYRMNTGNCYREVWTLKAGRYTVETLSMMAFRYVQVAGYAAPLPPEAVRGMAIRKPFDDTSATLSSDVPLLCDLHRLTKHTIKVTSQDIYVDSQSRERGAYEGDLYINMLAAYAMEDSYAPARFTTAYLLGHRTWPADYLLMVIFAARADYMATGDPTLLSDWYDTLCRNLFTDHLDETGLVKAPGGATGTNAILVDWPATERDGYDMSVPYNTVFNALHVRALDDMAFIATVLGRSDEAAAYRATAVRLRTTMIDRLYDAEIGRFRDGLSADGTPSPHASQHATAFALTCGVYHDKAMTDRLAAAIEADGCIRMSVYGAFFLLEGLYRTGHGAIANRLMLSTDTSDGARTWAYMLKRLGATVTTEAWNERNKPNMTLSHPWGAAPAHMIAAGIAGITPTSPGYATFDVRPCPAGIGEAAITVPTIRGCVEVAFRAVDGGYDLSVTVPANTEATAYLPDGRTSTIGAGEWHFESRANSSIRTI